MILLVPKPGIVGAAVSMLCVIHCAITPLLFLSHAAAMNQEITKPIWWTNLDYLFIIISFFSIYHATQNTNRKIMKPHLWVSWSILLLLIVNEKIEVFSIPEFITYITATLLAVLHLYNLKYCQCRDNKCCIKNG
ncbi:MerC domain-containing protein [uncultured Nonlabens sp.]|uniref:MerC domain-containing protein n=1 Tax=uncultured Nonlabens sp. TaxID=859306 RepID=UPI0026373E32|nr:MerC domain-containing protein [uncultured Nonlabens sp.]